MPTEPERHLRIGFLALTDAAPLIMAQQRGEFARQGLRVTLQREVGWATIREKIIFGELDAAPAPAPMLWSTALGLGCAPTPVLSAFVLNRHGNALTLAEHLHEAGVTDGATLGDVARARRGEHRITLGVVYPFSSHHLHLRQWLCAARIDPDQDVRIAVVPPAQMFRNLQAGTIDGFWAGEPWNSIAVRAGAGWCPTWSAAHASGHVEKVLMVTERFATTRAAEHRALLRAVAASASWCESPENRAEIAAVLSAAQYLNVPERVLRPALVGPFDAGHGRLVPAPDFVVFHAGNANVPRAADGTALEAEMLAAGMLAPTPATGLAARLFREDLHHDALPPHPTHEAAVPVNASGSHLPAACDVA